MKITMMKVGELKPYPGNPRKNQKAVEKVKESIRINGFNQNIVCDQNNIICVGHTRWVAAKEMGITEVPVYKKEMDEKHFLSYLIGDNKTNEYSEWEDEKLGEALNKLKELCESEEELEMLMSATAFEESELEAYFEVDELDDMLEDVEVAAHTRQVGGEKSHIKQVQIFLDDVTFPRFIEMAEVIQTYMTTDNLTDTIYNAVEKVHDEIKELK